MIDRFVRLLADDAPREAYDALLSDALAAGADEEELAELRQGRAAALRVRERMERHVAARRR